MAVQPCLVPRRIRASGGGGAGITGNRQLAWCFASYPPCCAPAPRPDVARALGRLSVCSGGGARVAWLCLAEAPGVRSKCTRREPSRGLPSRVMALAPHSSAASNAKRRSNRSPFSGRRRRSIGPDVGVPEYGRERAHGRALPWLEQH